LKKNPLTWFENGWLLLVFGWSVCYDRFGYFFG
jgi:hypothetical protein